VTVLLLAALVQVDLWPVTAFRLFSDARTADGSSLTLWAVGADGERTNLRPSDNEVLVPTGHLYDDLAAADPDRAREMVDAWLSVAGLVPADVAQVVLERTTWRMDPRTREKRETGRDVVTVVHP